MDPRLIEGLRRGQAAARDEALARLLVERHVLESADVQSALEDVEPGRLGARLVADGRLSRTFLTELERTLRMQQVLDVVAGPRASQSEAPARIGRYEIVEEIGRGAMGEVYRAHDPTLGRDVAIKWLALDSTSALQRFLREARIAAKLEHPNIPRIHEVEQHEGRAYLAFEFVDGASLAGVRLPRLRAAEVMRDAARAVQYAHEQGVVHRDLKPANLMMTEAGRVFVLDFGLAKAMAEVPALTKTGELIGTPAYMSPEQAQGFPADERSDVYGLGAVLYALVAGGPPYRGSDPMQVARRVAATAPEPLPDVDALSGIVARAMARERRDRYASAGELADALEAYVDGRPAPGSPKRSWWSRLLSRDRGA